MHLIGIISVTYFGMREPRRPRQFLELNKKIEKIIKKIIKKIM